MMEIKRITIECSEDFHKAIKAYCKENGISIKYLVIKALEKYIYKERFYE